MKRKMEMFQRALVACFYVPSFLLLSAEGTFDHDSVGRSILWRYLSGQGETVVLEGPSFDSYFANESWYGTNPIANQVITNVSQCNEIDDCQGTFDGSFENGEAITGANYLHGSNGGVEYEVVATYEICDETMATVEVTFNDVIDPNGKYPTDRIKNLVAESVTLGQAESYSLKAVWRQSVPLNNNGISSVRVADERFSTLSGISNELIHAPADISNTRLGN